MSNAEEHDEREPNRGPDPRNIYRISVTRLDKMEDVQTIYIDERDLALIRAYEVYVGVSKEEAGIHSARVMAAWLDGIIQTELENAEEYATDDNTAAADDATWD